MPSQPSHPRLTLLLLPRPAESDFLNSQLHGNYQGLRPALSPQHGCPVRTARCPSCPCLHLCPRLPLRLIVPSTHPYTTSAKVTSPFDQMMQAPRHAMYDGGGGRRDLTLERPDEEIVSKVQRPRSPPFCLPAVPPARPSSARPASKSRTRSPSLATSESETVRRVRSRVSVSQEEP